MDSQNDHVQWSNERVKKDYENVFKICKYIAMSKL